MLNFKHNIWVDASKAKCIPSAVEDFANKMIDDTYLRKTLSMGSVRVLAHIL